MQRPIVLASSSRYRRELLNRLHLPFQSQAPDINETPLADETPVQTCVRLAREKAKAIANDQPQAIIIASDQVADVDGEAVSKPGTHERARAQLRNMRGKSIVFSTAVCLHCAESGQTIEFMVPTTVEFRHLSDAEIERYLLAEQPYDCAGSAKSEGLGISLLKRIESTDPTALVGLPLIKLTEALREFGVACP